MADRLAILGEHEVGHGERGYRLTAMSLAGGLRELLRPPPHRGPLIAAGGVALGVGLALTFVRLLDQRRPLGDRRCCSSAARCCTGSARRRPTRTASRPRTSRCCSATGLPLLYAGLFTLLNGTARTRTPGRSLVTAVVVGGARALAGAGAQQRDLAADGRDPRRRRARRGLGLAVRRRSPQRRTAGCWSLYAAGLVLASLALREPARRHAEVLIDAAGLAIASIGVLGSSATTAAPAFFEVVLLGAGLGLVAFGALDRSPGPAYLGVLNLLLFIAAAATAATRSSCGRSCCSRGGVIMLGRRPAPAPPAPARARSLPGGRRAAGRARGRR